ncbi:MAG: hypothetical protein K9N46_08970 [Candidatus Marinimicrobia bacterium]|nr:hypothetical protein [Candidatus Neomarinimicrobiota bacterium]MCF7829370.1 hypothetical protein [Candidatus Neomarinimicrobiota bacterium]MCF7880856.1 hypothetical protein [Candidatus Neomarinimicrobiota bacterium]
MDLTVILSVASFVVILVGLVLLRSKNSKIEVKPTDIVVAVLPVVVFLLATGRLQTFEVTEKGVKIEAAFVRASTSDITSQVAQLTGLPSEPITMNMKGGVGLIPRLLEEQTEGLLLRLGYGGYYGPAIRKYLTELTSQPFLKYVIIENPDRTFFGMADARELSKLFQNGQSPITPERFAAWLNDGQRESLSRLPGFISSRLAAEDEMNKAEALRRMEEHDTDILPVLDETGRFVGLVNRSRLTASLLIEVSKNLEE